jgi:hypothetical protein
MKDPLLKKYKAGSLNHLEEYLPSLASSLGSVFG